MPIALIASVDRNYQGVNTAYALFDNGSHSLISRVEAENAPAKFAPVASPFYLMQDNYRIPRKTLYDMLKFTYEEVS